MAVAVVFHDRCAWAEKQDARKHYDQATAAFGLGHYADAAVEYEAAFRLRPEPALLYNCAQSYRLAGNKSRALELYRNYVRLYGDAPNADDARKHIGDLDSQIAAENAAAKPGPAPLPVVVPPSQPTKLVQPISPAPSTPSPVPPLRSPPPAPTTVALPPPPPPPAPAAPPSSQPQVDLTTAPPPPPPPDRADARPSLTHQPWFWMAVGAVAVGGVVAVLLATRSEKDPSATLGTVAGN